MRNHLCIGNQNLHQLENGKDVSLNEVRFNYNILNKELDLVLNEINEAVDKNDYVKLLELVDRRNQLHVAIGAIKSLYDDETLSSSIFNRIINRATNHLKMIWNHIQKLFTNYTHHLIKTTLKIFRIEEKE